jgi:hypothetical protein
MVVKFHKPKNLDETIELDNALNWLVCNEEVKGLANYIVRYLNTGELLLVDTLGQNINQGKLFERTITNLKRYGIDTGYKFLVFPSSQKPEHFKKLYVLKTN